MPIFNLQILKSKFRSKHFTKFLKYTLVCIVSIVFTLILIELSLRFYQFLGEKQILAIKPYQTTLTWVDDPDIGKVLLKPNSSGWMVTPSKEYFNYVAVNDEGFYDNSHRIKKPDGIYRILFLGDSFVASLQTPLEKTFFKQVEASLNRKNPGKKIQVIALGMGDTGTAQQFIALKKIGLKYKPDLVISMFLTANDLKNNSPTLQKDPYRPYFILDKNGDLQLLPHQLYSRRSAAGIKNWVKNLKIVELALQTRQTYLEYKNNQSVDYPIDYHVYDVTYNHDYTNSLNVTKKLILAEKKAVEDSGGKFLLITLANNEQVNDSVWEELKKTYPNLSKANLDLQKPDKEISSFCVKQDISCLEMLPTFLSFTKSHPDQPTHYKFDGHWNQLGTNIAAKFLINSLESNYFSIK